ncbi:MAG TPA: glycosyltransferase family 2 protein [Novosphingobium sp.]|nr:glycosyltransferase family 2 protein [Novosphingobium sp.]
MRIGILATCFNRRSVTLQALDALRAAVDPAAVRYHVYLVDDGSTDGTGDAVRAGYPEATVIQGDGSLFWNQGMRRSWQAAMADRPDYYLWLNDDLQLLPGSLDHLLAVQRREEALHGPRVITVGKTTDARTGETTYGGYRRKGRVSRLNFRLLEPGESECDTMNGNCVLIPGLAADEVGIHAERFSHGFGDIEYGLRAAKRGYRIVEDPEPVGHTDFNHAYLEKTSRLGPRNARFILTHPKGLPPGEVLWLCRQHGGWIWPANFVLRYLKILSWKA